MGDDIRYGKQGRAACLRNAPCNPREYTGISKSTKLPNTKTAKVSAQPKTNPRKPTKRYYLGGAIIYGDEGGAHHRNNAPQTPRSYHALKLVDLPP